MRFLRWMLMCLLMCFIAAAISPGRSCSEVLLQEDFDSWTRVPEGKWKSEKRGQATALELTPDGRGGKAVRATAGLGEGAYIAYDLGSGYRELYISFRVKIESVNQGKNWEERKPNIGLLQIIGEESKKTEWRAAVVANASRQLSVAMFTPNMGVQNTGIVWSPGDTLDIGLGIRYDKEGFVKFYYRGVEIYDARYDTTDQTKISNLRHLRFGVHFGSAATVIVDDVRVATTESEAQALAGTRAAPPPIRIAVDGDDVLRQTKLDCFGVAASMIPGPVPYTNLRAATQAIGFTSVRWARGGTYAGQDWDLDVDHPPLWPQPFYYKARDPSSPVGGTGRSFEEHLSYFGKDPRLILLPNIWGTNGSDYQGKKLDGPNGWVQYNLRKGRKDCIYEIGNEMDIPQYLIAGYMHTGASWVKISTDVLDWPPPGPERTAQSLMHAGNDTNKVGYDYTFPFNNKQAAAYFGSRYRWSQCRALFADPGAGNARLAWAIWTDKGWLTVHSGRKGGGRSYLLPEHQTRDVLRDQRNFTTGGSMFWSQDFYGPGGPFDQWTPAAIGEITSGACRGSERLYYVKVWLEDGAYTKEPRESQILFTMAPSEYAAVAKSFALIIRKNGAHAYAGAMSVFGYPGWLDMLESLSDDLDGYAFHGYSASRPDWEIPERSGSYTPYSSLLYSVESLRKTPEELRKRKPFAGKMLALTEWGILDSGHLGGLSTAIGLCEILKGGWDIATRHMWHDLNGRDDRYGLLCSRDRSKSTFWFERPSATAFRMIRHAAKSSIISTECRLSGNDTAIIYPGVYVCAFRAADKSDTQALVIINRTDIDFTKTPILWKTAAGLGFGVTELRSAAGLRGNNETTIQVKQERLPSIRFSNAGEAKIDLPRYSMFVLESQ